MEVLYSGGLKRLNKLILRHFSWDLHSEIVKTFHEDIVVSNIRPEHITEQEFKVLLRTSRGSTAYQPTCAPCEKPMIRERMACSFGK